MYLVIANSTKTRRLLNSWVNPGTNQKRLEEGVIERMGPKLYRLMNTRLAYYLEMEYGDEVSVYEAELMSESDLSKRYREEREEK